PTWESVISRNSPPLMFGEETSRTYPSQKIPSLNSVLKLFRKLITALAPTVTFALVNTLSLIPSWSPINASLGALSGDVTEVTHIVPSPGSGLVATQPAGNAGAATESQFSTQLPIGLGDGLADGVGVGVPPPG